MTPETFDPEAFTQDSRKNWSDAAPYYDRISSELFPPITKVFAAFAELREGQTVLDVACGPGAATEAAVRAVGAFGKLVGVDLSSEMLKIAGKRLGAQSLNVEFREMNAETLDFPDGTFDAVICQLGLMLFAKPEAALSEMARVAKKGGSVSCLVQGVGEKMVFTSLINRILVKHAPELKVPGAPTLYTFAPSGVLDAALIAAGLVRTESGRQGGVFRFNSPKDYWDTMVQGAGRTGAVLKTLSPEKRAAVENDALETAERYRSGDGIDIPYEVVMAKGFKP